MTLKDGLPMLVGVQYTTGEQQSNSSRRNEEAEPKWKQCPVLDMSGGESKVQCCKEKYSQETWNITQAHESREIGHAQAGEGENEQHFWNQ